MHHGQNRGTKKPKLSQQHVDFAETGECIKINFAEIEGIIHLVEICEKYNKRYASLS